MSFAIIARIYRKIQKKIHSQKSHRFDKENVWLNSGKRLDEISLIFYGV